jgi:hypothetical protein
MKNVFLRCMLVSSLVLASVASAMAADFSFTGNLQQDDNVQLFTFSVGAPSNVTLRTWSYAGGTNAAGQAIPRGGFDPILALFDSTGALVGQNDDGGPLFVPADAVTGAYYDTFLQLALGAGSYSVSVMQYNNFAVGPNLSNGFGLTGQPNFTQAWSGGNPGYFYDVTGNHRDGHWAFDILGVESANQSTVPEPSTFLLLGAGLGGLALLRRKARK